MIRLRSSSFGGKARRRLGEGGRALAYLGVVFGFVAAAWWLAAVVECWILCG